MIPFLWEGETALAPQYGHTRFPGIVSGMIRFNFSYAPIFDGTAPKDQRIHDFRFLPNLHR